LRFEKGREGSKPLAGREGRPELNSRPSSSSSQASTFRQTRLYDPRFLVASNHHDWTYLHHRISLVPKSTSFYGSVLLAMDAPPPSLLPSSLPIGSPFLDLSSLKISSDASQPCLQPFPFLANELKKEILRFCDPSTLAKTSLVSLAFLELSTPFLYYEVETRGCKQLSLLFKPRVSAHCVF